MGQGSWQPLQIGDAGGYPGLSSGPNVIIRVLVRGRQEDMRQSEQTDRSRGQRRDLMLLALVGEEGAMSQ